MEDCDGLFHLSTYMYPEHRRKVLKEIRERLAAGLSCRVISTSLVEAGVDLDFESVYREVAGLDSVIQAAGRCNREGKRPASDSVAHVFRFAEGERRRNDRIRQAASISDRIMEKYEDFGSPEAIHEYFDDLHYIKGDSLDRKGILKMLDGANPIGIPFRTVAEQFHIIEENTRSILIPREPEAAKLADQLRYGVKTRQLMRQISRYSVNVFQTIYDDLNGAGMLEELDESTAILRDGKQYLDDVGLNVRVGSGEGIFF